MKIAVLGCGKMTSAMVARWLQVGALSPNDVRAVTRSEASAARVQDALGVPSGTDPIAAIGWADVVLLGIKPQQAASALPTWRSAVPEGQLWLSVLAGTRQAQLEAWLGTPVARLMPNTPVRLGAGATAVVWSQGCDDATRAAVSALLTQLGVVVELPESKIDAFTALAGSGPAYAFLFLEALAAGGVALGLDPVAAEELALGVLQGAAALAAADPRSPAALRAEVTSPGGMTEAAISVFDAAGWPGTVSDAMRAARQRADELAAG